MSKTLSILIGIVVIIVACLLMYNLKNSYKVLPFNESGPEAPLANNAAKIRDWREFYSSTGHFKVLLPTIPQHAGDIIADPKTKEPRKYDTFVAADNGGPAYMISAITFPRDLDDDMLEATLQSVVDDMLARNKANQLKSKQFGKMGKYKALDFTLTHEDMFVAGKVFAEGDTLYVLSLLTKADNYKKEDLDFFINSFSIQNDPEQAPTETKPDSQKIPTKSKEIKK